MSNLTSTVSNETSISSSNAKNESSSITNNNTMLYTQQQGSSSSFASQPQTTHDELPHAKKKRSLPGNPDPSAEVIALSPKSLLATNKFVCEICNKGFQRDQNLQLHRRGHNLPWKLKQRANKDEIIKKVYVCPEHTCVHHDPSRALGDLTGIKKHFCRKHCEKKWKCEKCLKKYAVQSDWKAHSKICGTREYRCDCGTLFSRRDSFITHRAFCDALSEETVRSINPLGNPNFPSSITHQETLVGTSTSEVPHISLPQHNFTSHQSFPTKREPAWMAYSVSTSDASQQIAGLESPDHQAQLSTYQMHYDHNPHTHQLTGPTLDVTGTTLSSFQAAVPTHPHISATALLQRAAVIGTFASNQHQHQHQHQHQLEHTTNNNNNNSQILLSQGGMLHDNNISNNMLMNSMQSTAGNMFDSSFQDFHHQTMPQLDGDGKGMGGSCGRGGGEDGKTRDFLGLRTFSHKDFLNMASKLGQMRSSSSHSIDQPQQGQHNNQTPW